VRLTALLAFYDEQPKDLILYVASLTQAHVDNLIAIDGAYQLYPHTTHHSPPTQHATLAAACQQARIQRTRETHRPLPTRPPAIQPRRLVDRPRHRRAHPNRTHRHARQAPTHGPRNG
jgi:hypothetical protein